MRTLFSSLVLSFLVLVTSSARAEFVFTTLTLDPASPMVNRINLNFSDLESATTTDISGTIDAIIDIDLFTGVITSIELGGGSIDFSDWTVDTDMGTFTGTDITGTTDTPNPPSLLAGNMFDAAEHELELTGGVVNPGDNDVTGTIISGAGDGTMTSTLNGNVFDIVFNLPVDETNTELGTTLIITGNVVASGQIAMVPEPASGFAWLVMAMCGVGRARVRRLRPSN